MKKSRKNVLNLLKNVVTKSIRNATLGILSSINDCDH